MRLVILRHAQTAGNLGRCYIGGDTDEPLCAEGIACARAKAPELARELAHAGAAQPPSVWVSPLARASQTADLLFPGIGQVCLDGLREMRFGAFEGKTADELGGDERYRSWVEGMCEGACPQGESRAAFSERSCDAVRSALSQATELGAETCCVVAHGGTVMAAMEAFARPARSYFSWHVACCCGYLAELGTDGMLRVMSEL